MCDNQYRFHIVSSASGSLPAAGSGSLNGGFGGGTDGFSGFDALGNQNGTNSVAVNFYLVLI